MAPKSILSNYFGLKTCSNHVFFLTSICTYFVISMCALFSQKKFPHFLKKNFFLRKHDFSWKLEGGTGLQVVTSNHNIYVCFSSFQASLHISFPLENQKREAPQYCPIKTKASSIMFSAETGPSETLLGPG